MKIKKIIQITEVNKIMKARLPKGYGNGGTSNLQQLARQAQKMQEEMDIATQQLEEKEYTATAGGAVTAVVTGKFEIKTLDIKKEAVDPEDIDMLSDMITAAVNEAIRKAREEKTETMDKISGGLNVPGLF